MVTHETYSRTDPVRGVPSSSPPRRWTARPTEQALRADNAPVDIGRVIKMSKSKKNVVDPDAIIARHGADPVRWFMLSDSPPERDLPWSDAGIEGCARFVQRLWRLFSAYDVEARGRRQDPRPQDPPGPSPPSLPTSRHWASTRPWPASMN